MKITKLSLTNFRSFKETQTINFVPVTLLFGPNSVGKSTVLMALFYLQQILEKGQCNPQRLEVLGNKFVGGFKSLVNGKDLTKSITIKVEYQKSSVISGSTFEDSVLYINDIRDKQQNRLLAEERALLMISSPVEWANTIAVELEIKWSESAQTAFVCRHAVWLDDIFIAESVNPEYSPNAQVQYVNYLHPLLKTDQEDEWFERGRGEKCFHPEYNLLAIDIMRPKASKKKGDEMFNVTGYCGEFHDLVLGAATSEAGLITIPYLQQVQLQTLFQYKSIAGVLPLSGKILSTSIEADDLLVTRRIEEVFSDIFVATLDNLADLLKESLCIGPLRQIPDSTFDADQYIQQKDWYTGKASWDLIYNSDPKRLHNVNQWIAGKDSLDLGYALVEKSERGSVEYIKDPDSFSDAARAQITTDADDSVLAPYIATSKYKRDNITLWDLNNDIEVTASDIGSGVSQVFPLVVAATAAKKGLICCEQPELHIHPKAQVALGDLLTQTDDSGCYLIETHSENLVLRLLRRVRETSAGILPEGLLPVSKHDISIVYLESSEQGVVVSHTAVTDDGDLNGCWPNGFFDERDEELF